MLSSRMCAAVGTRRDRACFPLFDAIPPERRQDRGRSWIGETPGNLLSAGRAAERGREAREPLDDQVDERAHGAVGVHGPRGVDVRALGVARFDRATKMHTVYLSEYVTPYNPLAQEQYAAIQGSVGTQTASPQMVPEAMLAMKVKLQALVLSFQDGFMSATFVFLGALFLVLLLKKPKSAAGAAGAH